MKKHLSASNNLLPRCFFTLSFHENDINIAIIAYTPQNPAPVMITNKMNRTKISPVDVPNPPYALAQLPTPTPPTCANRITPMS